MVHLLFVCTGNICRSPTAERLAIAGSNRFAMPTFAASSAGTRAVIGHPIHPESTIVLEKLGGDATAFAARQLTPKIAANADLVLTMTRSHRNAVLEICPQKLNSTFTLNEAAKLINTFDVQSVRDLANLRSHIPHDESLDIADPIGQRPEIFSQIGSHIGERVETILNFVKQLGTPDSNS